MLRKIFVILLVMILSFLYIHPLAATAQVGISNNDQAYVWTLVEIVDFENNEGWKTEKTDFWQYKHSYGQGSYSATIWHKDDNGYFGYGAVASWSSPPNVIKGGEKVSLEAKLSETENTHKWNTSAASTYADFASPDRGVGSRGDIFFINADGAADISINGAGNTSASASFTAIAPEGGEGSRIALRLQFYMGTSMATYYVYEWQSDKTTESVKKPVEQTSENKDTSPKRIIVEFSDRTKVDIAGYSGQVEISLSGNEVDFDDFLHNYLKKVKKFECKDNMVIQTGSQRSGIILGWDDLSTFVVGPETTIVFKKVEERRETKLELVASNIWVNVKKLIKDGTMEVTMNHATAGIKGTNFVCEDDGVTSTLKVIEGSVEFVAKADGKKEIVGAGEMITATAEGIGEKTRFNIKTEQKQWEDLQTTMRKSNYNILWIGALSIGILLFIFIAILIMYKKKKLKSI